MRARHDLDRRRTVWLDPGALDLPVGQLLDDEHGAVAEAKDHWGGCFDHAQHDADGGGGCRLSRGTGPIWGSACHGIATRLVVAIGGTLIVLAPPARIERATLPLGGGCSIH